MVTASGTRPAGHHQDREHGTSTAQSAILYAERGWPVLPGSVFDGRCYIIPATRRITNGLRPLLPRDVASMDPRTVAAWWKVTTPLAPSVLLRTGQSFYAVSVSRQLAVEAIQSAAFRAAPGPVMLRPDQDRAYFLVGLGESMLPPDGARPTVIEPVRPGAWFAAPPTRTAAGGVAWLVPPQVTEWTPVGAGVLAAALRVALPRVESASWGGASV